MSSTTASASASTSASRTVFGTWHSTPAENIDLEAQTITGTHVALPLPVATPTPSRDAGYTDPIDDFFGVTRSQSPRATQNSRHDAVARTSYIETDVDAPPPYADASDLPSYTAVAEPPTLAMYLFKFGFRKSLNTTLTKKP